MRDYTFPYVLLMTTDNGYFTPSGWSPRARRGRPGDGQPTDANLRAHIDAFEASTRPGGVNAHIGPTTVLRAEIRKDTTNGPIVARYSRG